MVSEPFVVGGQNEILVLLIQRTILHVIDFACGRQSQLTSEILLAFLIDVALPGSIGAMNRYGAQTQHHAPPVSDMPYETAETQRNQQKRRHDVPPDGG